MVISIHMFLAEGDLSELVCESLINIFQSTPSSQKVTTKSAKHRIDDLISIHTFLAEGDSDCLIHTPKKYNFNPHLPRRR